MARDWNTRSKYRDDWTDAQRAAAADRLRRAMAAALSEQRRAELVMSEIHDKGYLTDKECADIAGIGVSTFYRRKIRQRTL